MNSPSGAEGFCLLVNRLENLLSQQVGLFK